MQVLKRHGEGHGSLFLSQVYLSPRKEDSVAE